MAVMFDNYCHSLFLLFVVFIVLNNEDPVYRSRAKGNYHTRFFCCQSINESVISIEVSRYKFVSFFQEINKINNVQCHF